MKHSNWKIHFVLISEMPLSEIQICGLVILDLHLNMTYRIFDRTHSLDASENSHEISLLAFSATE